MNKSATEQCSQLATQAEAKRMASELDGAVSFLIGITDKQLSAQGTCALSSLRCGCAESSICDQPLRNKLSTPIPIPLSVVTRNMWKLLTSGKFLSETEAVSRFHEAFSSPLSLPFILENLQQYGNGTITCRCKLCSFLAPSSHWNLRKSTTVPFHVKRKLRIRTNSSCASLYNILLCGPCSF